MTAVHSPGPTALGRFGWAKDVDALNIGLMLLSGAAAFTAPFEVFLFAYAVLGPLHYLTQIGWLHQRSYFLPSRLGAAPLWLLGAVAIASTEGWLSSSPWTDVAERSAAIGVVLAVALAVTPKSRIWLAVPFAGIGLLVERFTREWNGYTFWLLFMVPTLLHVFGFTLLFVLRGAQRSRRRLGYVSAGVLIAVAAVCFLWRPGSVQAPSTYALNSYGYFSGVNVAVIQQFELVPAEVFAGDQLGLLYNSPVGLALMRFIAFAYTYHYLNWFSKTSVIKWHRVEKWQLATIVALWLCAVGLYLSDYARGMRWLAFLSFAHVLLELPLNVRTGGEFLRGLVPRVRRNNQTAEL